MVTSTILTAAVIGILGVLIGILLDAASEKFKVQVDEKEILVRNELPGNNCGGCGYAGCDALAKVTAADQADVGTCPVGGTPVAEKVGEIVGVADGAAEKKVAFVKCAGTCDKTKVQYNYYGVDSCKKVSVVPGTGEKACAYGCMGYGFCVKACVFDAIHAMDGVVVVDRKKRAAYGICAVSRPNHPIELIPYRVKYLVRCSSHDKGKDAKAICATGCIGCTLCIKQCEFDVIHMENSLAVIDYEKCTNCGKCAEKCPAKTIV